MGLPFTPACLLYFLVTLFPPLHSRNSDPVFSSGPSQNQITIALLDAVTKTPVPFATVYVTRTKTYRDADSTGRFVINAEAGDSAIISCIGYETLQWVIPQTSSMATVFMEPIVTNQPTVLVRKPTIEEFGTFKRNHDRTCIGGWEGDRLEIAALVEIPQNIAFYRIASISIKGKDFNADNPVRLHIYNVDSNGLPGKELLQKQVIITKQENNARIVTIDVKDQQIMLENNAFFVGVQWITSDYITQRKSPEIYETFAIGKQLTFRRSTRVFNNAWTGLYRNNIVVFPGGKANPGDIPINIQVSSTIEVFEKK